MEPRKTRPVSDGADRKNVSARLTARVQGRELARLVLSKGSVVVGSGPDCGWILDDPTVSRRHLDIQLKAGGVWVKDLDSVNGTRFQGSQVKEAFLPLGAILKLGEVEVRVEEDAAESTVALGPLVSRAPAMIQAIAQLAKVAPTDVTVLLEAETGCGKEVTARALHDASARKAGPFETVDCGALPAGLAASELFGHVKGAFTGADRAKAGAFERARGGTLFLDEIGELPLDLQPLLLRALESRQVRRVGDEAYRPIDVRVIAATNRDLKQDVASGLFRKDLLHRLAVVQVRLPPLRERRADIPALVRSILDGIGERASGFSLSPDTLRALAAQEWPGNVRELRNLIERALAMGDTDPVETGEAKEAAGAPGVDYRVAREKALDAFEREFVIHVLRTFDRNVSKAARESGIDRVYLHKLIKKHGLAVEKL